jgi:transcriptional regulator with XRE-family HTH domain
MTSAASADRTPLSVLLFHAAMGRELSISDFATELEIGPISLRQFIIGKTQRPRTKTLEQIAAALNLSLEDVRERMNSAPRPAPPFGDWLEAQMGDRFSRARLGRDAKISDGALRNYLQNDTLPDSDQAQRLVEVLGVDPLEIAHVIVANDILARGGQLAPPAEAAAPTAPLQARTAVAELTPVHASELAAAPHAASAGGAAPTPMSIGDEDRLLNLWRRLHPQGRRATFHYIAELLAEG